MKKRKKSPSPKPSEPINWVCSDGRVLQISDMEHDHLLNAVKHLEKLGSMKMRAITILAGPSLFPYREVLGEKGKELFEKFSSMSDAELADFFFPKYKHLIRELEKRNTARIQNIIHHLEDEIEELESQIAEERLYGIY